MERLWNSVLIGVLGIAATALLVRSVVQSGGGIG
jgi:hypothetical protein